MFIIAKRVRWRGLIAGAAVLVLALGAVGAGSVLARDARETAGLAAPFKVRSDEDRVAYLTGLGWQVAREPAAVEDVLIPETFDPSYDEYLALQEAQGFDLTAYAGKTVQRYTYQVFNYPGLQEDIWASLLVYRTTVIGGEIACASGDGFLQGLAFPVGEEKAGAS